jgi:hypothetical protein
VKTAVTGWHPPIRRSAPPLPQRPNADQRPPQSGQSACWRLGPRTLDLACWCVLSGEFEFKTGDSTSDIFDKALEKLWVMDFAENVSCGQPRWRKSYLAHGKQKRVQIDLVIRYAESNQCRVSTLVRHFGDLADGQTACGICDFCAPAQCVAQRFRTATEAERTALFHVIASLRAGDTKSTGKLHGELCPNGVRSRDAFEEVLGAMARAGLVRLSDAVFENDGKQIPYRKVSLTRAAHSVDEQTPIGSS